MNMRDYQTLQLDMLTLCDQMSSPHIIFFGGRGVHVAHLFSFLCCVGFCFCFLCVNVASISRLSILDCPPFFFNVYLHKPPVFMTDKSTTQKTSGKWKATIKEQCAISQQKKEENKFENINCMAICCQNEEINIIHQLFHLK